MNPAQAFTIRDGRSVKVSEYQSCDHQKLLNYLLSLGPETKSRFGPHPFTSEGISGMVDYNTNTRALIAHNPADLTIVAYTLLHHGMIVSDSLRYQS